MRRTHLAVVVCLLVGGMVGAVSVAPASAQVLPGGTAGNASGGVLAGPSGTSGSCLDNLEHFASGVSPVRRLDTGNPATVTTVVWPPQGSIPGASWISGNASGLFLPSTLTFRVTFTLPAGFLNAGLEGTLLADDTVSVRLNGNQIFAGGTFNSTSSFATTNQAYFKSGLNTLDFVVTNPPAGNPEYNPLGLDFIATVSHCRGGFLEVCKDADGPVTGTFEFTVPGVPGVQRVTPGLCAPALHLRAGDVTVTEVARPFTTLVDVYTLPAGRLVGSPNLSARTATVSIVSGDISTQTRVHFVNRQETGQLKICKATSEGIPAGTPFTFTANGQPFNGEAGACVEDGKYPIGSQVTVKESIPSSTAVKAIAVDPPDLGGAQNLQAGSVVVTVGEGITEVTYTNQFSGRFAGGGSSLEVCKATAERRSPFRNRDLIGRTFSFQVLPENIYVQTMPGRPNENNGKGRCVLVGSYPTGATVTVGEVHQGNVEVIGIALRGGTGTFQINPGRATITLAPGLNSVLFENAWCSGRACDTGGASARETLDEEEALDLVGAANRSVTVSDVTPAPGSVVTQRLSFGDLAQITALSDILANDSGARSAAATQALRRALPWREVEHSARLCGDGSPFSSVDVLVEGEPVVVDVSQAEGDPCATIEFTTSHIPSDLLQHVLSAGGSVELADTVTVAISARTESGASVTSESSFTMSSLIDAPKDAVRALLGPEGAPATAPPASALQGAAGSATVIASRPDAAAAAASPAEGSRQPAPAAREEASAGEDAETVQAADVSSRAAEREALSSARAAEREAELSARSAARQADQAQRQRDRDASTG
jgi:hypothetical protein